MKKEEKQSLDEKCQAQNVEITAEGALKWCIPYPPPTRSIATHMGGAFAYSPYFRLRRNVRIQLTGSRGRDYTRAEHTAGVRRIRGLQLWHHVFNRDAQDNCTMQLVNVLSHVVTCPHAGGCAQYAAAHGVRYRAVFQPIKVGDLDGLEITQEDIDTFEKNYCAVPAKLKDIWSGKIKTEQLKLKAYDGNEIELDYWLDIFGGEQDISVQTVLPLMEKMDAAGAFPFALDPCGNFFCIDGKGEWFFLDHETSQQILITPDI